MLNEEVQESCLVVLDFREFFEDCVGDEVGTPAARGQGELFLEPGSVSMLFLITV